MTIYYYPTFLLLLMLLVVVLFAAIRMRTLVPASSQKPQFDWGSHNDLSLFTLPSIEKGVLYKHWYDCLRVLIISLALLQFTTGDDKSAGSIIDLCYSTINVTAVKESSSGCWFLEPDPS